MCVNVISIWNMLPHYVMFDWLPGYGAAEVCERKVWENVEMGPCGEVSQAPRQREVIQKK